MSSKIGPLIERFHQSTFDSFLNDYRQTVDTDEYLTHMNQIVEQWRSHLLQPTDPSIYNFIMAMSIVPSRHTDSRVLKGLICFLKSFKDQPFFEDLVLSTLMNMIEASNYRTADYYRDQCQPAVWELFDTMVEEGLLRPEYSSPQKLRDLVLLCLVNNRMDQSLADKLITYFQDIDIVNSEDDDTRLTLMQKLLGKPYDPLFESPLGVGYLMEKGANVNQYAEGTIPPIVLCAKNHDEALLLKFREQSNLDLTVMDKEGKTAYFYLLLHSNLPPDIIEKFKPSVEGLNEKVAQFLEPSQVRNLYLWEKLPYTSEDLIIDFISAWKERDPVNECALTQATRIFLYLSARPGEKRYPQTDAVIELFKLMKDEPHFEHTLFSFLSLTPPEYVLPILEALEGYVSEKNIPKEEVLSLVLECLKHDEQYIRIADILFKRIPDLKTECVVPEKPGYICEESFLLKAVESNNAKAVLYLLEQGCDALENERLLALAAGHKDPKIVHMLLQHGYDVNERNPYDATPLFQACKSGSYDVINRLLQEESLDPSIPDHKHCLPIQIALEKGHFEIAGLLFDKYGVGQFSTLYDRYRYFFEKIHGLPEEDFPRLAAYEMNRVLEGKNGQPFDKGVLTYYSREYENIWPQDQESISRALEDFPLKAGLSNFIPMQVNAFKEMQRHSKTRDFPIKELWRFAIDAKKEEAGPYAFENEPGYLKGFFQGMEFALRTAKDLKTEEWYQQLLRQIVDGVCKLDIYDGVWNPASENYVSISPVTRFGRGCSFSIQSLDQDPIGIEDLKTRMGSPSFKFIEKSQTILYSPTTNPDETSERLHGVMERFNSLLPKTQTRAQKLILFLWAARELEIEHVFHDANGRASHLALLSMIAGEDSLPMFLLPDPNILDGNGPESLAARYLEACINFRHGGIGHSFEPNKEVKKLDSIELLDEDLITLREELRPCVENKTWELALKWR